MLTRLTVCLGILVLAAGCRSRDVEKDLSITDIHTGWYDVGVVDGQNKLVPSITLRLQNVSSEPISRVQINAVFRRVGDLFGKDDPPVPPGDLLATINAANLRAHWTNTVGLGFRLQTPFGGALAVDYGFLLNPPEFLIPQRGPGGVLFDGTPAVFRLHRGNLHFRITQTF